MQHGVGMARVGNMNVEQNGPRSAVTLSTRPGLRP